MAAPPRVVALRGRVSAQEARAGAQSRRSGAGPGVPGNAGAGQSRCAVGGEVSCGPGGPGIPLWMRPRSNLLKVLQAARLGSGMTGQVSQEITVLSWRANADGIRRHRGFF